MLLKKLTFIFLIIGGLHGNIKAQLKVGNNPNVLNANAIFEIEHTNKGMLLPRIALTNTTSFSPMLAHVEGMVVYNTATNADVTPGYYYNDGAKWIKLLNSSSISNTTAGQLLSVTNGTGASLTAMTISVDTTALKNFINSRTTNTLTAASSALTSTVNGVVSTLTPSSGTIASGSTLGFDASGNLVKGLGNPSDSTTASNGLTMTGKEVRLGGSLTAATIVTTSATNTLSIAGLQSGTLSDSIVVADATTSALRRLSTSALGDKTQTNNGLTKSGDTVKLGGLLTAATTVTTSVTNTLALAGLQSGTIADSIVMINGTTGILKKMSTSVMSDKTQANNGLTKSGDTIQLGGNLTKGTTISMGDKTLNFSSVPTSGTSHFSIDSTTVSINAVDNSVGIGTRSPHPSAILDLNSLNKGVLLPRLSQVQRDVIPTPSIGLAIYNTTENCINFYEGTKWRSACKANINATFQSATLNCGGTLNGDYVATLPMNNNNFKQVTVTCNTPGDYTISTNSVNGVVFSGEGTLVSSGAGTSIVLKANGTPISSGTFTYTVTLTGLNCTFNITFLDPPAQLVSDSVDCNTSSVATGTYMAGVPMTVSNIKAVKTVPESIGFCNIETDVVNGVKFSRSTTFTAGQVNNSQTISLIATGTPLEAGTFTYTVGGTDVTNACNFQVTFVCPKPTATILTNGTQEASTTFASALVSPAPGKFLIFGTSNLWTNDYLTWLSYRTDFNGALFTDNSFIRANCPWNATQTITFGGEVSVASAGSHSLRMYQVWGSGGANYRGKRVLALYIPTTGNCDSIIAGSIGQQGFQTFNNTPTSGTHRFNLTVQSAGKLVVVSSEQMGGPNSGNNYNTAELSYDLKVGSQTSTNKILANAQWIYKRVNGLGVFDVTGGNVSVDMIRTQGSANQDPTMQYIFIPATSRAKAGHFQPISGENVNNIPSANSNRFSINLPAGIGAGQLILLGNMNMWRNSAAADLGYNVNITTASTSNSLVTTATIFNGIAANAQEQIPFFTKYDITSTEANSVIHIDYVPNTTFNAVGAPRLAWIFIPN